MAKMASARAKTSKEAAFTVIAGVTA